MTSIRDTADLAREPPIPALWAATAFTGIVCVILTFQVFFSFTKLRMVCLVACITTLILTITNTLDTYYPLKLDIIHSFMFAFFTIFYFDLIIAIFLDIGSAFYYLKDRKTLLFWIVIILAASFSIAAGGAALALFLTDASDIIIFVLSVFVAIACLSGMIGAVAYAFIPLIRNRNIPSSLSDAYAVGIWYLTVVMVIMLGYIVFYTLAFVNVANYNPLGQINQGIDFCFRSVLVLAYGLPPSRSLIRFIRRNFLAISTRIGSSPTTSRNNRSSGVVPESQKADALHEVVVAYPYGTLQRSSSDITN